MSFQYFMNPEDDLFQRISYVYRRIQCVPPGASLGICGIGNEYNKLMQVVNFKAMYKLTYYDKRRRSFNGQEVLPYESVSSEKVPYLFIASSKYHKVIVEELKNKYHYNGCIIDVYDSIEGFSYSNRCEKNDFKITSFGEFALDEVIYYIDIEMDLTYCSLYRRLLMALYLADRFGWKPYISIGTERGSMLEYSGNLYDLFFKQPTGYSESQVRRAKNIVFYSEAHLEWIEDACGIKKNIRCSYDLNDQYIELLGKADGKYISYRDEIESRLKLDTNLVIDHEKCIGIHYRSFKHEMKYHPVRLEPEDYFAYIDECICNGFSNIFLATDDKEDLGKFKKRYGDRIRYFEDVVRAEKGHDLTDFTITEDEIFQMGYEVYRDVYALSMCDALICGHSQVAYCSIFKKIGRGEQYKYFKMLDKGRYSKTDEELYIANGWTYIPSDA